MLSKRAAVLVFSCLLLLSSAVEDNSECPKVCQCDKEISFVKCEDESLIGIPTKMPKATKQLSLAGNLIPKITRSMLEGCGTEETVEMFNLMDNKLHAIEAGAFVNMHSLSELYLLNNSLTTLQPYTFRGLKALTTLDLSRNSLSSLKPRAFAELTNLSTLHLWGNRLYQLAGDAFFDLTHLDTLSLGDNLFEDVPTNAFKPLTSLRELKMLNLPVKNLIKDAFRPLIGLEKLHISNWSSLNSTDAAAFRGLTRLSYLSMQSCRLTEVPHETLATLPSLTKLNLSFNKLKLNSESFKHLSHLRQLYLSGIGTHFLHESPFKFMTSLTTLDLSNNEIEVLPNHLFLQLGKLQTLNISNNDMDTLSWETIESLHELTTIDISSNPIICDCNIKWLRRHQETRLGKFELDGVCTNPDSYSGIPIRGITLMRFSCDPPQFFRDREEVVVSGDDVIVKCVPDLGNPQPLIEWDLNFDEKSNQNKYKDDNGLLHISKVTDEDFDREFVCVAQNEHGIAKHSIYLSKHYHPGGDGRHDRAHNIAVAMVVIAMLFAAVVALICWKKRTYIAIRRSLLGRDTSYSHF